MSVNISISELEKIIESILDRKLGPSHSAAKPSLLKPSDHQQAPKPPVQQLLDIETSLPSTYAQRVARPTHVPRLLDIKTGPPPTLAQRMAMQSHPAHQLLVQPPARLAPPPADRDGWHTVGSSRHLPSTRRPDPIHNVHAKPLSTAVRIFHQKRIWKQQVPNSIQTRLRQLFQDIKPAGHPSPNFTSQVDEALDITREMMRNLVIDELQTSFDQKIRDLQQMSTTDRPAAERDARRLLQDSRIPMEDIEFVFAAARPPVITSSNHVAIRTSNPFAPLLTDNEFQKYDTDDEADMEPDDDTQPRPLPARTPKRKRTPPQQHTPATKRLQSEEPTKLQRLTTPSAKRRLQTQPVQLVDVIDITDEPTENPAPLPLPTPAPANSDPSTVAHDAGPGPTADAEPVSATPTSGQPADSTPSTTAGSSSAPAAASTTASPPPTPTADHAASAADKAASTLVPTAHRRFNLDGLCQLRPETEVLILADQNASQWPTPDKRFWTLGLEGCGLQDIPDLYTQVQPKLQRIKGIVIAVGLNNAMGQPHLNHYDLERLVQLIAGLDKRLIFTALPEFEQANATESGTIIHINKLARNRFVSTFIRLNPSTAVDLKTTDKLNLNYGPLTGKSFYDSVATFLFKLISPPFRS